MIKMTLTTRIYPTESEFTVKQALRNVFDFEDSEAEISTNEEKLYQIITVEKTGVEALDELFRGIRKEKIVEAFRQHFLSRMDSDQNLLRFKIHKQALMVPSFHVCELDEESPLGPVEVTIESPNILELINYLAPPTVKGEVQELPYKIS